MEPGPPFVRRGLVPRRAASAVSEALSESRVVLVNGARQAGKSTLVHVVAGQRADVTVRTLDDPDMLAAARRDPKAFVEQPGLLVIDEVQRAPELLLAIKLDVDAKPRPGRFLLTGSSRLLAMRAVPDTLPGRVHTIELWPFSQGEIGGEPDGFIDAVFAQGPSLRHESNLTRADYARRVLRGGFPESVARVSAPSRRRFLAGYLSNLVEREVMEVGEVERMPELRQMMRVLAARSAGSLVIDAVARDTGLSASTVRRYVALLEEVFVLKRLPPWSRNLTTRAVATPKICFVDAGVAAALLAQDERTLVAPTAQAFGPLLEGFVVAELMRQATWSGEPFEIYHFRTRDQVEVDIVLEHPRGAVVGIEVKAAATVRVDDFRGLTHLRDRVGGDFEVGIVLYAGSQTLSFGDRLLAMPLSAVWRTR